MSTIKIKPENENIIFPKYDSFPTNKINIDDLQSIITSRIILIDYIDSLIISKGSAFSNPNRLKYLLSDSSICWKSNLNNDNTSFFFVALAFCNQDSQRNWLANIEAKLFLYRINHYAINKDSILRELNIPLYEVSNVSKDFEEKIKFKNNQGHSSKYYKIPFEYVLNLVPTMNYYIYKGYVYVNESNKESIIETVLKESLLKKYYNLSKSYDSILEDKRIFNLIHNIEKTRELNKQIEFTVKKDLSSFFSINDIEDHAETNFPLCMQVIHRHLNRESHLKHEGRLQYSLFLKGIGLTFDESMTFWKKKFMMKTNSDKFDKEYSYNIRHSYGLEGKRVSYPPWTCHKIQGLPIPNIGESHGCPYKYLSEERLRSLLYEMHMKEVDVMKILDKKKTNEYSICCIRQFEAKFPSLPFEKVGIHPNYYFESAVKTIQKKKEKVVLKVEVGEGVESIERRGEEELDFEISNEILNSI